MRRGIGFALIAGGAASAEYDPVPGRNLAASQLSKDGPAACRECVAQVGAGFAKRQTVRVGGCHQENQHRNPGGLLLGLCAANLRLNITEPRERLNRGGVRQATDQRVERPRIAPGNRRLKAPRELTVALQAKPIEELHLSGIT